MTQQRIMYVCSECADSNPEGCGHYDEKDLRVLPGDRWLCEGCFDDTNQIERGNSNEDKYLSWSDLPAPPRYAAVSSQDGATPCKP